MEKCTLWSHATALKILWEKVNYFPFDVIVFTTLPAHAICQYTVLLLNVMWPWTSQFWVHCSRTMPAILQIINSSVSYKKDAKAFPLIWAAAAMQMYWKKCQFNSHAQDCFGTLTWLVTVSLFWDTKIVVVISQVKMLYLTYMYCTIQVVFVTTSTLLRHCWNGSQDLLLYSQGKSWYYAIQKINSLSMQNIHTWKFVGCQTYLVVNIDNKCSKNLTQCPGVCFIVPSGIKKCRGIYYCFEQRAVNWFLQSVRTD